jgi:hypothetical protein
MRFGSYDGLNEVYYKSGKPILENNEKVIKEIYEKCGLTWCKKKGFSKSIGSWNILHYSEGKIYLTNSRFIFIRRPLSWEDIQKQYGAEGAENAILYDIEAKKMRKKKVREFIEFEYDEIDEVKKGLIKNQIKLSGENKDYIVSTKKHVIDEVNKVIKKYS